MSERIPFATLVNQASAALLSTLERNGYKEIAFTVVVQNMEEDGTGEYDVCNIGNLKPEGVRALLEGVLEKMEGKPHGG